MIDPYFGLTKIMWERDNEPELYRRAIKSLNQKDFVVMRMTGEMLTDRTNAALMGIAYDIRRKDWDADMLRDIGLDRAKLPDICPCDEIIGRVNRDFAAHSGLLAGTPVVNGAVDGPAAWLSMGATDEGDSVLTLGSSAIWAVAHREPGQHTGFAGGGEHREPSTYVTAAATSSGGALLRWFRDKFGGQETAAAASLGVESLRPAHRAGRDSLGRLRWAHRSAPISWVSACRSGTARPAA